MSVDLDCPSPECREWAVLLEAATKERNELAAENKRLRTVISGHEKLNDWIHAELDQIDGSRDGVVVERINALATERDSLRAEVERWRRAGFDGIDNMADALGKAQAERDAAIARADLEAAHHAHLRAERDEARQRIAELERELERHRHGETIEGDFVCPNEFNAMTLEQEVRALRKLERAVARWHGEIDFEASRAPGEIFTCEESLADEYDEHRRWTHTLASTQEGG